MRLHLRLPLRLLSSQTRTLILHRGPCQPPKKAARRNLLKALLPATDVPESYVDAYDKTIQLGDGIGTGIGLTGIKKILESSGLNPALQAQVLNQVVPGGQEGASGLSRNEFNVLLALIGLGQEGEDATLDGVDERKRSEFSLSNPKGKYLRAAAGLPIPKIPYLDTPRSALSEEQSNGITPHVPNTSATRSFQKDSVGSKPRRIRQDSLGGDLESDPWASPGVQKSIPPIHCCTQSQTRWTPRTCRKVYSGS